MQNLDELITLVESRRYPDIHQATLDAMMTGETFFFRDTSFFNHIKNDLLPDIIRQNGDKRSLRIWCAACSTGQEPYSVAMILDEFASRLRGWDFGIIASDISLAAIERAMCGEYNQFEVQRGLPVNLLLRYFQRNNERWQVAEHLKSMITFEQSSVLNPSSQKTASFDLILCRNMLIYFSDQTRDRAITTLTRCLAPQGRLVLGSSEASIVRSPLLSADTGFLSVFKRSATNGSSGQMASAGDAAA